MLPRLRALVRCRLVIVTELKWSRGQRKAPNESLGVYENLLIKTKQLTIVYTCECVGEKYTKRAKRIITKLFIQHSKDIHSIFEEEQRVCALNHLVHIPFLDGLLFGQNDFIVAEFGQGFDKELGRLCNSKCRLQGYNPSAVLQFYKVPDLRDGQLYKAGIFIGDFWKILRDLTAAEEVEW